jgi:bifunctional non-homologous end joining protein LigD
MAADSPTRYLIKMSKAERAGRLFIDYLRNDPTATAVGPYSTRSRPGAPVATPLHWDEVDEKLDPTTFHIGTIRKRLSSLKSDPWAAMLDMQQELPDLPFGPN